MDRNPKLSVKFSDFIGIKRKERRFFYHFFCAFQHNIMNTFHHLPTQVIKPMLLGHVLDFKKVEKIFEGLIVHQGTTFPQQIKYDNKVNHFLFLLPNLPQIQLMNHIAMKTGSMQCFIFLVHRIFTILDCTLCHPKVIFVGLFSPCMFIQGIQLGY